jgi:hypothetical protein
MSYLSSPRLHFNGFFQADVSTINNDVRFYDSAQFKPQYQMPSSSGVSPNGAWQPEGTGTFRLVGCTITGGWLDGAAVTAEQDRVLGMALENSDQRVSGKLVDLDPQQQLVSEIWGMALRLTDDGNPAYFNGQYAVAAFNNGPGNWRTARRTTRRSGRPISRSSRMSSGAMSAFRRSCRRCRERAGTDCCPSSSTCMAMAGIPPSRATRWAGLPAPSGQPGRRSRDISFWAGR